MNTMRLGLMLLAGLACWSSGCPLTASAQDQADPELTSRIPPGCPTRVGPKLNPCNWDTANIMAAIYTPHPDLYTIAAHRGIHSLAGTTQAPYTPENSLTSIRYAAQEGWEAIEIDVKLTKDGQPILSHDKTWGREWCGYKGWFGPTYDPFNPTSAGSSNNPYIGDLTELQINPGPIDNGYPPPTWLRDSVSLYCGFQNPFHEVEFPPLLSEVYDYIKRFNIQMVVVLDIQSLDVAQAAWPIVAQRTDAQGRNFSQSTIWKIPAALFGHNPATATSPTGTPIGDFLNTFPNVNGQDYTKVNFNPVFHTTLYRPLDSNGNQPSYFASEQLMVDWLTTFRNYSDGNGGTVHMPAVEVSMKDDLGTADGSILEYTLLPFAQVRDSNGNPTITTSEFQPVGEYYGTPSQPGRPNTPDNIPQFFRSSDGSCCQILSDLLYNNPANTPAADLVPGPYDHADNRPYADFLVAEVKAQHITSDRPDVLEQFLSTYNLRNISYMQASTTPVPTVGGGESGPPIAPRSGVSSGPVGYLYCESEGTYCEINGTAQVAFGPTAGPFVYRTVTGGVFCDFTSFGSDPAPEFPEACYYTPSSSDNAANDATLLQQMEAVPHATWLTDPSPTNSAATVVQTLSQINYGQGILPTFVLYNIPGRDCGGYSAGGAQNTADYEAWIDAISGAIGNSPVIIAVEPDSLADLPSDCGYALTTDAVNQLVADRYTNINYAINSFENHPHASVYLDGGNSHWQAVPNMAQRLFNANIKFTQGFFSNISNYNADETEIAYDTMVSECLAFGQSTANQGWRLGNFSYCASQYTAQLTVNNVTTKYTLDPEDPSTWGPANEWFTQNLGNAVPTTHFIIDTSRNGQGPFKAASYANSPYDQAASTITTLNSGAWCNPPNRGLGVQPTVNTQTPLFDAGLWIKTVGLSDGPCDSAGGTRAWDYTVYSQSGWPNDSDALTNFDPLWGLFDPPAGTWFPQQALQLAQLANPALSTPAYTVTPPSDGYIYCANENSQCTFRGSAGVLFGPSPTTSSTTQTFTGGTACTVGAFGTDPSPGQVKYCWYKPL